MHMILPKQRQQQQQQKWQDAGMLSLLLLFIP